MADAILIGHKKLIAWQKSDELAHSIYKMSLNFPKNELYGLTSQLQRAALSVVLNIVEGYGRNNKKEFAHFLSIALGSLVETGYLLDFAFDQEYLNQKEYEKINSLKESVGQLTWKLYRSMK